MRKSGDSPFTLLDFCFYKAESLYFGRSADWMRVADGQSYQARTIVPNAIIPGLVDGQDSLSMAEKRPVHQDPADYQPVEGQPKILVAQNWFI